MKNSIYLLEREAKDDAEYEVVAMVIIAESSAELMSLANKACWLEGEVWKGSAVTKLGSSPKPAQVVMIETN